MGKTAQKRPTEVPRLNGSDHARKAQNGIPPGFKQHIERNATLLRQRAGVGAEERLDPRVLVRQFQVHLVRLDELTGLSPEDRAHIEGIDAKKWSGGGIALPNGDYLVILHPNQTPERAAVTIMEEIAHAHYGHQPSRLVANEMGMTRREYDKEIEDEAYWTAAATLLPSRAVALRVYRGMAAADIAAEFGASVELVEFRIKILNLWREYLSRHPAEKSSE